MSPTAISAAVPRQRVTLEGEVVDTATYVQPWIRLDVQLTDGTGSLTLRFLGRAEIPGMVPGRQLRIEGTPSLEGDALVILNPLYSFIGDAARPG